MKTAGWKRKVFLFLILAMFLGLQLCVFSFVSASAADPPGWSVQYSDNNAVIVGISAGDANNCWAVGYGLAPLILKTADAGVTWTPQDAGITAGIIMSVSAVNADTCWASVLTDTSSGIVLKTTDGGTTWNTLISAGGFQIGDLCAIDANTCWVAGQSSAKGFIAKTTDGGQSWSLLKSGLPQTIVGISAIDANTCWAVGFAPTGTILKTSNGGIDWVEQSTANRLYMSVSAIDSQNVWVSGMQANTYVNECYRSTDGGASWTTNPAPSSYLRPRICGIDANTAWLTATGSIAKTIDGGVSWTVQATAPTSDQILTGITAVDNSKAWAAGCLPRYAPFAEAAAPTPDQRYTYPVVTGGFIMHTSNGGSSQPSPQITAINPVSGDVGTEVTLTGSNFGATKGSSTVAFGDKLVPAASMVSWSDTQIKCKVPDGVSGKVMVAVTTPLGGASNGVAFIAGTPLSVTSIAPNEGMQFALVFNITDLKGGGFQSGATVRFEKGASAIDASNVNVVSSSQITCDLLLFGQEPGAYDVAVTNPDGQQARLPGAFTVTSPCGSGSGAGMLMLGAALGLLSLAGYGGRRKRKKNLKA